MEALDATGLPLPQFCQVPEPQAPFIHHPAWSSGRTTDDGRRTLWLDSRPSVLAVCNASSHPWAPTTSPSVATHPRRLLAVDHPAVGVPRPTSTVSLSILPSRRHATMVPPRDHHALTCHRATWPAATSLGNPGLHYRCPALRDQFLRWPPSVPSAVPLTLAIPCGASCPSGSRHRTACRPRSGARRWCAQPVSGDSRGTEAASWRRKAAMQRGESPQPNTLVGCAPAQATRPRQPPPLA